MSLINKPIEEQQYIIKKVKRFKELSGLSEVEAALKLKYPLAEYFKIRECLNNQSKERRNVL